MNDGNGQVVWITGGGSGIGRSLALLYASKGYQVVISGRREDKLWETQSMYSQEDSIVPMVCDVSVEVDVQSTVQKIVDQFQRLDILLANAGFAMGGSVVELSHEAWAKQMDVNLFGLLHCVRHAYPHLVKTGGRIALVSSVMAYTRTYKTGAYAASKSAVTAIGETLHIELQGTNVSCTVIHPGFVESEIGQVDATGHYNPTLKDNRPKQLFWTSEKAAGVMYTAIQKRKKMYTFTMHGTIAVLLARFVPSLMYWVAVGKK